MFDDDNVLPKFFAAEAVFAKTNKLAEQIAGFVKQKRNYPKADDDFKEQAATQAEELYRNDMWPLLSEIKNLSGDDQQIYRMAGELHAQTLLAIGELCVWGGRWERAVGMYNTAIAMAAENEELFRQCQDALARVRLLMTDTAERPAVEEQLPEAKEGGFSYTAIIKWIFLGILFMMLCWVGTVYLLVYSADNF